MKRQLKFPLKFEKGIREITGKRTTKEALKQFKILLLSELHGIERGKFGRVDEARLQERLRETLEWFRKTGFDKGWVEKLRREYIKLPSRKPRKKAKIKFDANGIPKVTKTPLDTELSALLGYLKVTKSD
jgi:hypothetical protein